MYGEKSRLFSLAECGEVVRKGPCSKKMLCDGEQVRMRAQRIFLGNLHAVRRLCAGGGREGREQLPFSSSISVSDFKIRRRLQMHGFLFGTRTFVKCKEIHAFLDDHSDDVIQVQSV